MKQLTSAPQSSIWSEIARLRADERGATAIEYGLIAALVTLIIVGAISAVGTAIKTNFYDKMQNIF